MIKIYNNPYGWNDIKKKLLGTADTTVPFKHVEMFCDKMHKYGNRCELVGYKGSEHAFFNFGRNENAPFIDTVNKMDAFLVSLSYLKGAPETMLYNK